MHVLVIDDDATFRKLLNLHLTRHGHEVSVAEDGIQGQRLARQLLPDVIVIDYQMPATNGHVVAQRISASSETQHIPMILVSGGAGSDVPEEIYEAGIVEVLSKLTLSEDDLTRALENAVSAKANAGVGEHSMLFPGSV